ncbi:hypothetical protein ACJDU8_07445 [Clostridium sp. WILCCON 0269]|uniref:Cell wall-binding protein n=1 Tax=Candidatus Clostridium eludens TaxID=3381663 RepID=A0ABW8SHD9_9CLOT
MKKLVYSLIVVVLIVALVIFLGYNKKINLGLYNQNNSTTQNSNSRPRDSKDLIPLGYDNIGQPVTGWIQIKDNKYKYLDKNGKVVTGESVTGWQKINGNYYNLDSDGNILDCKN